MTPAPHPTWSERRAYALAHGQRPDNGGRRYRTHSTGRGKRWFTVNPPTPKGSIVLMQASSGAGAAKNRPRNKRLARAARVARRVTRRGL